MQKNNDPGREPEPPKLFDRWMMVLTGAVSAFAVYGVLEMAGLV